MNKKYTKKYVIINADDLGLCSSTNKAIFDSYTKGILTSASILTTCPGFLEAVKTAKKYPKLGIGVHLSLTLGTPILPPQKIPALVTSENIFHGSFTRLFFLRSRHSLAQIENEFSAQIEKALKAKLPIDHLNSQSHVHMIPSIFPIVMRLAKKYHIPYVRLSKDRVIWTKNIKQNIFPILNNNVIKLILLNTLALINKKILSTKAISFFGVYHTGDMSKYVLESTFKYIKPGITEVLSHPGYGLNDSDFDYHPQMMYDFMTSPFRNKELKALLNPHLKKIASQNDITFINFKQASKL